MTDQLQLMLEAERRGILPADKVALLTEARSRGLVGPSEAPAAPAPSSGVPGPRQKATTTELALASPPARMLLGAATPFVGAFQLGANVGDWINKKIGQEPVVSKAVADWWNDVQAMKERGMQASQPEAAFGAKPRDILGTVAGVAPALMQPSTAITKAQQFTQGLKQGAITGAMQPGTERLSDQALGAAAGATLGAAAPVVIPAAAKALGWMWDTVNGRLVQVKAGKILREIAGDDLAAIQAATANAPGNLTAAQAVQEAGITAPVWQAMGTRKPTPQAAAFTANKEAADVAARVNQLQEAAPNLPNAMAVRKLASDATYEGARAADKARLAQIAEQELASRSLAGTAGPTFEAQLSPALQALKGNPAIAAAEKTARDLAATKGVNLGKDPMSTLEGLHYMKLAIDAQFKNPTATTALQNYSTEALKNTKTQLLSAIGEISPQYTGARMLHERLSQPVNQAQVLNELANTLKGSGTAAETAVPFLNALGQGESAFLARAGVNPRFGGVKDILTPEQMAATNKVAGELRREATMSQLATRGEEALTGLLRERPLTAPGINATSAVINKVSNLLRGSVSDKTIAALAKGMQSGKQANELLTTIPAAERIELLRALGELNVSGAMAGAAGGNALVPTRKNKNALAEQ